MLKYSVKTFRAVGLEAKWGRTQQGAPRLFARKPQTKTWFSLSKHLWDDAQTLGVYEAFDRHTLLGVYEAFDRHTLLGVYEAFDRHTLLGDIFFIPA